MPGTTVATTLGKVSGLEKEGVLQFRGIPFAAPPTGPRRFLAPAPHEGWEGVRECTGFGAIASQPVGGMEALLGATSQESSEDCLFLNVFTPAADDGARPVMVWIHGGGFQTGSGSVPWYDGTRLALTGDVVVVTVNYRLGALGFLRLDHLLGDAYGFAANAGLIDQVAALQWVRDNIAGFGGDPANVTIFGESAGGMSVGTLLAMPVAKGLFHRAIAESGAAHNTMTAGSAEEVTARLLDQIGLGTAGAEGLLDLPTDALLDAQRAIANTDPSTALENRARGLGLPFQPVIEGHVLPTRAVDAVAAGSAAGVPVLTGTTLDEWNLFSVMTADAEIDGAALRRRVARIFDPDRADDVVDVYTQSRPTASPARLWSAVMTDLVFRIPAIRLLEAQAPNAPVYAYRFDWGSTAFDGALGACHAVEIPFVFDNLHRKGVAFFLGAVGPGATALAAATSRAWLAFARGADPNHDGLPAWPSYDTQRRATMVLDTEPHVADDPAGAVRALWTERL